MAFPRQRIGPRLNIAERTDHHIDAEKHGHSRRQVHEGVKLDGLEVVLGRPRPVAQSWGCPLMIRLWGAIALPTTRASAGLRASVEFCVQAIQPPVVSRSTHFLSSHSALTSLNEPSGLLINVTGKTDFRTPPHGVFR